jgi:hypothetical protein
LLPPAPVGPAWRSPAYAVTGRLGSGAMAGRTKPAGARVLQWEPISTPGTDPGSS